MSAEFLYQLPTWLTSLIYISVLLAALEFGYFVGQRLHASWKNANPTNGQIILTSMFAVFGLMLAFTYGAGVDRFDTSKKAVVLEANAISTAFLRADLAEEPGRTELKQALLDYARTRSMDQGRRHSRERFQEHIQKSLQAQSKLWPITNKIVKLSQPDSIVTFLLVDAMNQVIDAHATRLAAINDKLPIGVILMLIFIASASLSVAGFNAGISGRLNRWRMTTFALVLVGVLLVINDFDHPVDGFIRVNHDSIITLIKEMEANLVQ
jgi:hypothetical protein